MINEPRKVKPPLQEQEVSSKKPQSVVSPQAKTEKVILNQVVSTEIKKVNQVYPSTDAEPQAVVVYCSDPRFQAAFQGFIHEELGLSEGKFIPLVIAGGADALSNPMRLPKEFKFMKDRLELYQSRFHDVKRIVLIGHEDCKYYESVRDRIRNFMGSQLSLSAQHKITLGLLPKVIASFVAPKVSVEIYFAKFVDETHSEITFEKVF